MVRVELLRLVLQVPVAFGVVGVGPDYSVVLTGVSCAGQVGTMFVWGQITPNQTPTWTAVSPSQSPGWGAVTPSQSPNWTDIAA